MLTSHPCFYPRVCEAGRRKFLVFPRSDYHQKQRELACNIIVQYNRLALHGLNLISRAALLGEAQPLYICTTEDSITGNERGKRITSCAV